MSALTGAFTPDRFDNNAETNDEFCERELERELDERERFAPLPQPAITRKDVRHDD